MFDKFNKKLKELLSSKEIRKKLFFTIGLLVLVRFLSAVPIPGINGQAFVEFFKGTPFTTVFSLATGGRLDNPSIMAIGLAPYINASIVIQLMQSVIKKLDDLSKEGQRGRMLLNQYTRILTVPIAIIQALVIYVAIKSSFPKLVGNASSLQIATMIIALTAGTILMMWIGELISEHGIGNGTSILIMAGILASLPGLLTSDIETLSQTGQINILIYVAIGLVIMIGLIVFVNEAVRKIPIQYARRVRGNLTYSMPASFFPIRLLSSGVMPIVFASSLLTFPQIIVQYLLKSAEAGTFLYRAANWLNNNIYSTSQFWRYDLLLFIFIVGFAFFYTFIVLKPSDIADNLKKSGGFIPGIRPGKGTADYFKHVILRLTTVGALFMALIALLPSILRVETNLTLFRGGGISGTGILIIVSVILETVRQLNSLVVSRNYDNFK